MIIKGFYLKIIITNILSISENYYEIIFDTAVGQGKAIFTKNSFNAKIGSPKIGEIYHIEFHINAVFESLSPSISNEKFQLYHQDNHIFFTGKIEEIDDDLLFFRLNTDCLMMMDFEQPITFQMGSFVSLTVKISDCLVYFH